jgi:hypothetical protein
MWHIDPLLGNDREISTYTRDVTRHRPVNNDRRTVFSVRSVLRCKQDMLGLEWVGELVYERTAGFRLLRTVAVRSW